MKSPVRILACCAALAWGPVAAPSDATDLPILAQDLKQLVVPGKIAAALWTRRTDNFTLQLVYPYQGRGSFFIADTVRNLRELDPAFGIRTLTLAQSKPWQAPKVQAWLLRPDGTIMMPLGTSTPTSGPQDQTPREIMFTFPRSATSEASAVAVNIDGEYRVQNLLPFAE